MDDQSQRDRNLERLERRRLQINERLEKQRARINERFDQQQAKLAGKLNARQEQIVAAALELLTEQGINNLSLRDIAKRVHLQAPALYWHFKNKEDLVDLMAEAILQKEFKDMQPRQTDETWQDWLTAHMLKLRKAMLAYPDGARVVAGAHIVPAVTLGQSFEYCLVSLTSAGVDLQTARYVTLTATNYTFGYVIEEQASPTPEQLASIDIAEVLRPYPMMTKSLQLLDSSRMGRDEDYLTGLRYIIAGSIQI